MRNASYIDHAKMGGTHDVRRKNRLIYTYVYIDIDACVNMRACACLCLRLHLVAEEVEDGREG